MFIFWCVFLDVQSTSEHKGTSYQIILHTTIHLFFYIKLISYALGEVVKVVKYRQFLARLAVYLCEMQSWYTVFPDTKG